MTTFNDDDDDKTIDDEREYDHIDKRGRQWGKCSHGKLCLNTVLDEKYYAGCIL